MDTQCVLVNKTECKDNIDCLEENPTGYLFNILQSKVHIFLNGPKVQVYVLMLCRIIGTINLLHMLQRKSIG